MLSANFQRDDVNNQKAFENAQTSLVNKQNRPASLPIHKFLSKNDCGRFVS
jgi:hypothetical protein